MEGIFGILRAQYDTFADNETVRNIVYTNMMTLKQKIGHAVQDFYSHVGTHFVSKLYFANYAYGYGTLQFDENSGNEEARVGVALSLGGGVPSKFSAESASSATFAQQSGWAGAMKNLHIEAHSRPGGMDLGSFASQIKSILSDEGTPLYVPTLKVPTSPTVEVLDTPALKKEVSAPPDSAFASYKEWKQCQAPGFWSSNYESFSQGPVISVLGPWGIGEAEQSEAESMPQGSAANRAGVI